MKSRKTFIKGLAGALTFGWLFSGNDEAKAGESNSSLDMRITEPLLASVVLFAGNFAPRGWAFCDGQLLAISQNTALFSLLGTIYGGDGRTTFGLPDLRGRVPIGPRSGPGLPSYREGQRGGAVTHTLTTQEIPAHTHSLRGSSSAGSSNTPAGNVPAVNRDGILHYGATADTDLGSGGLTSAGGSQPHNNMQPFLAMNYIIALQGVFPSRS